MPTTILDMPREIILETMDHIVATVKIPHSPRCEIKHFGQTCKSLSWVLDVLRAKHAREPDPYTKRTGLHRAARLPTNNSRLLSMQRLLDTFQAQAWWKEDGARVLDAFDRQKSTALGHALQRSDFNVARLLVYAGANPYVLTCGRWLWRWGTLLEMAARQHEYGVVKLYVDEFHYSPTENERKRIKNCMRRNGKNKYTERLLCNKVKRKAPAPTPGALVHKERILGQLAKARSQQSMFWERRYAKAYTITAVHRSQSGVPFAYGYLCAEDRAELS